MVKDQVYEDGFWSPRNKIVYDHKYRDHFGQSYPVIVIHLRNCNTRFAPYGAGLTVAEMNTLAGIAALTVNDVRNAYYEKCPNKV